MTCPRGHAYDISRTGYFNLLQPHHRRSHFAGDSKDVVQARATAIAAGVGRRLFAHVADLAGQQVAPLEVVVDLGCGTGNQLAMMAERQPIVGVGIDISTAAVDHAARQFPELTWVVANADRRLPIVDRSTALVLSLHGRRNAAECARVLRPGGRVIVAVPAPDDLVELRTAVHGQAIDRSREASVAREFDASFVLDAQHTVRDRVTLTPLELRALLRITYRGARQSHAARLESLERLDITLASAVSVFRLREPAPGGGRARAERARLRL